MFWSQVYFIFLSASRGWFDPIYLFLNSTLFEPYGQSLRLYTLYICPSHRQLGKCFCLILHAHGEPSFHLHDTSVYWSVWQSVIAGILWWLRSQPHPAQRISSLRNNNLSASRLRVIGSGVLNFLYVLTIFATMCFNGHMHLSSKRQLFFHFLFGAFRELA